MAAVVGKKLEIIVDARGSYKQVEISNHLSVSYKTNVLLPEDPAELPRSQCTAQSVSTR